MSPGPSQAVVGMAVPRGASVAQSWVLASAVVVNGVDLGKDESGEDDVGK